MFERKGVIIAELTSSDNLGKKLIYIWISIIGIARAIFSNCRTRGVT